MLNKYFVLASDDSEAAAERAVAVLTAGHRGTTPADFAIEPPTTGAGSSGATMANGDASRASGGSSASGTAVKSSEDGIGDEELSLPLDIATLQVGRGGTR